MKISVPRKAPFFLAALVFAWCAITLSGCTVKKPVIEEAEVPVKAVQAEKQALTNADFGKAYFEYNSWKLRTDAKKVLKRSLESLLANPAVKINVEGHCDERGTDAYNEKLGWKRAYAVRDYLKKMGVGESRLFPVSYGRSRPAVAGNDEAAWSKNRRVEFSIR